MQKSSFLILMVTEVTKKALELDQNVLVHILAQTSSIKRKFLEPKKGLSLLPKLSFDIGSNQTIKIKVVFNLKRIDRA